MMQRKHPGEAMTGEPGALPGEAIRVLIQIVAPHGRMCGAIAPQPCRRVAAADANSVSLGVAANNRDALGDPLRSVSVDTDL